MPTLYKVDEKFFKFWSTSLISDVTHDIHLEWTTSKLPVFMHSQYSHVLYNLVVVNHAPFWS